MTSKEFNKKCESLHREYKKIFGVIPNRSDYIATQEDYINGLNTAIRSKIELNKLLPKRSFSGPFGSNRRF